MSKLTDSRLLKVVSIVFNAALGQTFYSEIRPAAGPNGEKLDALVKTLGELNEARAILGNTPQEQARKLTLGVGLNPDEAAGTPGKVAFEFFFNQLIKGANPASLALEAVKFLEAQDPNSTFLNAIQFVNNRGAVAEFFTLGVNQGGTDISALQAAMVGVTSNSQTVEEVNSRNAAIAVEQERNKGKVETFSGQNDNISGTEANNFIDAGFGNDTVNGLGGNDILIGNGGNDSLFGGQGADLIEAGDGADRIDGGSEAEERFVNGRFVYTILDISKNVLRGGDGADTITGSFGGDEISGGSGADFISGERFRLDRSSMTSEQLSVYGSDLIYGGDGQDTIDSGAGNDTVFGDSGDDRINGGSFGAKYLDGGEGNDSITLSPFTSDYTGLVSTIFGGAGNDTINAGGSSFIDSGIGNDSVTVENFMGSDITRVTTGEGQDRVIVSFLKDNSKALINLTESTQVNDVVDIRYFTGLFTAVEITGFDLNIDRLELGTNFSLYGTTNGSNNGAVNDTRSTNFSNVVTRDYVQFLGNTTETFRLSQSRPTTKDDYGKAFFVIQNATAQSASKLEVASLIDAYGNNATYENGERHLFAVNIKNVGVGLYLFTDDTGANNRVIPDELTPIAFLIGQSTEQFNPTNFNVGF